MLYFQFPSVLFLLSPLLLIHLVTSEGSPFSISIPVAKSASCGTYVYLTRHHRTESSSRRLDCHTAPDSEFPADPCHWSPSPTPCSWTSAFQFLFAM